MIEVSETIIVGLLSLLGTIVGTLGGIMVSNKLTMYRIEQLELAVKENRKQADRIYSLEQHNEVQDTKVRALEETIKEIKTDVKELKKR